MARFVKTSLIAMAAVCVATPAFAQDGGAMVPDSVGYGLIVLGAGLGIGRIGGSALESMARQPEKAGQIQVAMLIAAALIEGLGFAALFGK